MVGKKMLVNFFLCFLVNRVVPKDYYRTTEEIQCVPYLKEKMYAVRI